MSELGPTGSIVLLWAAFLATHVGLASVRVEPRLQGLLGRGGYLAVYSLVALAIFVPLVWIYFGHRHFGAPLWGVFAPGPWLRAVLYLGNLVGFVMIAAALLRPSPAGVLPGDPIPHGIYHVTRHPLVMGFSWIALMHLVPNGSGADVAFFGGLIVFSLLAAWHQDVRKLHGGDPGFRAFHESTPFLPFTGPRTLQGLRELRAGTLALALALTLGARLLHGSLWP